jgi:hypothetical protein
MCLSDHQSNDRMRIYMESFATKGWYLLSFLQYLSTAKQMTSVASAERTAVTGIAIPS